MPATSQDNRILAPAGADGKSSAVLAGDSITPVQAAVEIECADGHVENWKLLEKTASGDYRMHWEPRQVRSSAKATAASRVTKRSSRSVSQPTPSLAGKAARLFNCRLRRCLALLGRRPAAHRSRCRNRLPKPVSRLLRHGKEVHSRACGTDPDQQTNSLEQSRRKPETLERPGAVPFLHLFRRLAGAVWDRRSASMDGADPAIAGRDRPGSGMRPAPARWPPPHRSQNFSLPLIRRLTCLMVLSTVALKLGSPSRRDRG